MMMKMTLSREHNRNINNINSNRSNNNSTIILIAMITSIIVIKNNQYGNNRICNNIYRSFSSLFFDVPYTISFFLSLSLSPLRFSYYKILSLAPLLLIGEVKSWSRIKSTLSKAKRHSRYLND